MAEPVDDEVDALEPVIGQDAVKLRTLQLEVVDDTEDQLYLASVIESCKRAGAPKPRRRH